MRRVGLFTFQLIRVASSRGGREKVSFSKFVLGYIKYSFLLPGIELFKSLIYIN